MTDTPIVWAKLDPETLLNNEWSTDQYLSRQGDVDVIVQVADDGWVIVRSPLHADAARLGFSEKVPTGEIIVRRLTKPATDDYWDNCTIEIFRGVDAVNLLTESGIDRVDS